jgi:hypothetical protein
MTRLLGALGRDIGPSQDGPFVASFLRGLTAGALIGAAIAGSALLQRRRAARSHSGSSAATRAEASPVPTPAASIDASQTATGGSISS